MEQRIKDCIANEDQKNPLTDEQIAQLCSCTREEITILRQRLNIPDSRERRRVLLYPAVQEALNTNKMLSDRKLTSLLNAQGFQISRFIAKAIKDEISKVQEEPLPMSKETSNKSFEQMIGYDGSMRCQISQAQAAVLYPPKGIHTLIHGPSGVGKSQLAEAMYHFSLDMGVHGTDSPFVIFNCADYAENPELLLAQLFGYVKGAFTGADTDKKGLIEKANGGIIFLDEVHRLSSEGQEMLFFLIDKGLYRKLGETESTRKAELLIIAATTEDLDSYLLTTFRRRIPMVIDLPPLHERPLLERYMIIKNFFHEEALRIDRSIVVEREALKRLLLYPCPGNIGQLRSDIQVSCARSFLKYITLNQEQLVVTLDDLPTHISNYVVETIKKQVQQYCDSNLMVSNIKHLEVTEEISPTIYQIIEEKYDDLTSKGYKETDIYEILGKELDEEMDSMFQKIRYKHYNLRNLEEIVGLRIIRTVQKSIEIAKQSIAYLSPEILSPLCLHISASYERLKCGKIIRNPQLDKIKKEYPLEFQTAKQMGLQYYYDLHVQLTDDEVAFIAMYLKTFSKQMHNQEGKIGIIVLTHGNVGIEMVEVANQLLNVNSAIGLRCGLDESSKHALEKTQRVVESLDTGKGCLILTDMGSLVTFGEIISKRTGIDTRTISRVDTVMVIEAIRRVIFEETTLDELEMALHMEKAINFHGKVEEEDKEEVIVAACLTGKGSAVLIQSKLQTILQRENISLRIIPLGIVSETGIEFELDQLSRNYKIITILGNFKIDYRNIPFISTTEILNGTGIPLFLDFVHKATQVHKKSSLKELLYPELILCQEADIVYKNDIIEALNDRLVQGGFVMPEYLLDVYKREAMGATIMGQVAIPHGFTEHVTKPAIAMMILKEKILWEDNFETNIVLIPAFQEECISYTYDLFSFCMDKALLYEVTQCQDANEIIKKITNHTKPSK